jgi:hydroxymethylbilane synthase
MNIVIGTRGSKLALAQAEWVAHRLRGIGVELSLRVIRTTGDRQASAPSDIGPGVFVKEIEQALLSGEVSLAVHSLKDLPTGPRQGLWLAAVPEREDPSDALVMMSGSGLSDLAIGARVGTGSPRRAAQLRAHRQDLELVPVRGNVDTRLGKLERGDFDALVVASAGLIRLGMADRITQRLPSEICLPAPGQGALALQVRQDDERTRAFVSRLDHGPSRAAAAAERAFLEQLGGGCTIPVGALGRVDGDRLVLEGVVAGTDGGELLRDTATGPAAAPEGVGAALAERLLAAGARSMLQV